MFARYLSKADKKYFPIQREKYFSKQGEKIFLQTRGENMRIFRLSEDGGPLSVFFKLPISEISEIDDHKSVRIFIFLVDKSVRIYILEDHNSVRIFI